MIVGDDNATTAVGDEREVLGDVGDLLGLGLRKGFSGDSLGNGQNDDTEVCDDEGAHPSAFTTLLAFTATGPSVSFLLFRELRRRWRR